MSRSAGAEPAASAMPKSVTIASPSWRRMFSGLMSRWTSEWRMGVVQCGGDLADDLDRFVHRQPPLGPSRSRREPPRTQGIT